MCVCHMVSTRAAEGVCVPEEQQVDWSRVAVNGRRRGGVENHTHLSDSSLQRSPARTALFSRSPRSPLPASDRGINCN